MLPEFNLDNFVKNSRRVKVEDLPWDTIREHPLTNGEIRFLKYMMNIESHTILYLRDLLSTSVVDEDDVCAFLSIWAYEEFFHGYYLERFTKTYVGEDAVVNRAKVRLDTEGRFLSGLKNAVSPALTALSPDFAATHMTWGATQEYTTLHAYESVARQTNHPMLKELMARIVKDERRHFAFYFQQAKLRLDRSPFMQKETRFFMDKLWTPVGTGVMPKKETDFVAWYLFRDEKGMSDVREVDAMLARLPGMDAWRGLESKTVASIARYRKDPEFDESWTYARRPPIPSAPPIAAA